MKTNTWTNDVQFSSFRNGSISDSEIQGRFKNGLPVLLQKKEKKGQLELEDRDLDNPMMQVTMPSFIHDHSAAEFQHSKFGEIGSGMIMKGIII